MSDETPSIDKEEIENLGAHFRSLESQQKSVSVYFPSVSEADTSLIYDLISSIRSNFSFTVGDTIEVEDETD